MKQTVQLENLSCQNCVKHVTKHFLSMEGVSDVAVDVEQQIAHVKTDKFYGASDYEAALAKTIYRVLDVVEAE